MDVVLADGKSDAAMEPYGLPRDRRAIDFDQQWAALALLGTTVSFFIAVAVYALRLGLTTPPALLPACVLVVATTLSGPLLIPARGAIADIRYRAVTLPIGALAIFVSTALSFWIGKLALVAFAVVGTAGLVRAIGLMEKRRIVRIAILAVAVAAYLFIVVHNLGYAGVLTPEQGLLGLLNHDTRIHAAIAYLIQQFGTPSIGVDGILPLRYHFGSHIWFAALGLLTGSEPAWSYGAAVPIVAAPLLVSAALLAALAIDQGRKPLSHYLWIGLSLIVLSDSIDIKSYYISESYTFGLIGLLFVLPLLSLLANSNEPNNGNNVRFGFFIAILALPVLCSFKVSVGVLWTVGLAWVTLRRFGLAIETVVIGAGCLLLLLLSLSAFAPGPGDYQRISNSLIVPLYYLRSDPQIGSLASLLLPLCLVLLRFSDVRGAWKTMTQKSELMTEAAIIVTLVGAVPSLVGIPQDSSVWYFLNVGQWYAISLLVGYILPQDISGFVKRCAGEKLFYPLVAVLAFVVMAGVSKLVTPAFFDTFRDVVRAADRQADGKLLNGKSVSSYFIQNLKSTGVMFAPDFQTELAASAGSDVIRAVRDTAPSHQLDFAVFIPPSNTTFWEFQSLCRDKHNIQVALTGEPSLFGGPPSSYNCPRDAYTMPYGDQFNSRQVDDSELCEHAKLRNIRRVLILNDLRQTAKNRIVECKGP